MSFVSRRGNPELINTKEVGEEAMKVKKETKAIETVAVSTVKRDVAQKLQKVGGKELDYRSEKEEKKIQVSRAQRYEDRKLKNEGNLKIQNREIRGADKQENKPVRISTPVKKGRTFIFDKTDRKSPEDNSVKKIRRKSAESNSKSKQSEHLKFVEDRINENNSKLEHSENRQRSFELLQEALKNLTDQSNDMKITEDITPKDDVKKEEEIDDTLISVPEIELSEEQDVDVNVTPKKYDEEKEKTEIEPTSSRQIIDKPIKVTETLSPSISKRTRVFSRRNKIEPADIPPTEENTIEKVVSESTDEPSSIRIDKTELPAAEKEISTAESNTNICPACKKQKYQSVYKDKRGRFYCESCATPNSTEMLPITGSGDNKRIICANCGRSIAVRKQQDVQPDIYKKSNICPKCSQAQVQVFSVP